ncbi:MAG: GNAT family N-acetyltransferase [Actinomycetota bacterium]|nr:GNAT family N-acetyltransferase [Actinomycetota bacterium]
MTLRLRPLERDDENEARRAHAELAQDAFAFLLGWEPRDRWADYLSRLRNRRRGVQLPADRVPATFLVAEVDGVLVGRTSIRHELNDHLAAVGGHIGYGVRPGYRRRGYATEILRQSLIIARAEGVDRVLLTCEEGNGASAAVIERFGGVLEDVRIDEDGTRMRRYWIA